ncbi:TonB-dependent receptor plug domain-containing protein, partial [Escherichia coli]|uniref:TonB-dependent receptor plug domain-containing protein n=1 Tax=Escherichia coli TaxID=562 RepID=UPI003EDF1741
MYMNVIRNVICTLIILPIGLQAETSHSSMAKDTITVVATGNQNTVFETPSMVSVVTNDTPWSQNAVTSAGMLKGVAGLSQTGAGRTNGQTFNLRGYDKSGGHCCKVSDEAAFCLIQRPYISKTLLTRR